MKVTYLIVTILTVMLCSCSSNRSVIRIPSQQYVEIDYPNYDMFRATLKNTSSDAVDVAVISKQGDEQVRGFGLGPKSKVDVVVESENKLVIRNSTDAAVAVKMYAQETKRISMNRRGEYVSLTLKNPSVVSIPLIIPTVMNPNLSPMSTSGVDLKIGQEIFFKANRKKYLLLTIDDSLEDGDEINVSKLLKERKKELGIK